jgi:aspartate-semialdehyde dehydrogenase
MHAHGEIAVAGATGRVGGHVVDLLEKGNTTRLASPDLSTVLVIGGVGRSAIQRAASEEA